MISKSIAILGGTGKQGKGLAYRWGKAGHKIIIGSRSAEKAHSTVDDLTALLGKTTIITGADYLHALDHADVVVLAVPFSVHQQTLEVIKKATLEKLVLDITVPLVPPRVTTAQMPPAGSAALETRKILGVDAKIASAFQNISHEHLMSNTVFDCDVLVTGSDKQTRLDALSLVADAGFIGWDAGPLENSMVVEGMTSILIHINKMSGSTHAGIKITGIDS